MCAHTRPRVRWGRSFVDDCQVGSDSVFGVDIRVNWDWGRWPILASALKAVSLIISESSAPQFSVMITESAGTARNARARVRGGGGFVDKCQEGSDSVFDVDIRVICDCGRCPILASALKAVSLIISESSAPQFSMMITESTGTVRAYDTKRQVGKQFRGRLPSRQRLSFRF